MEFKEFPEAFATRINEQIRDFTLLKENEMVLREEEITSRYNSLGVIDDGIKSYYRLLNRSRFLTVLITVTLLAVAIGFIYALEKGFDECWSRVLPLSLLLGLAIGSVGRMLAGEIIGSALFFLLYPLYRYVCNKRVEGRMKKRNAEIGQVREKLKLATEKFKEKKQSDLEAYRHAFEEEVGRLSADFAESDNTRLVGDKIAGYLIEKIKGTPRPASLENVNIRTDIRVDQKGVGYDECFYDFTENRCRPLEAPGQQGALLMALCRYVAKVVSASVKKDVSGEPYRLKCSYALYSGASAHLDYTCKNGGYVPPRDW